MMVAECRVWSFSHGWSDLTDNAFVSFFTDTHRAVDRWLHHPLDELSSWQRWLRYVIDLVRYCVLKLNANRAPQMAAALTYRTIFSLVPVLVISLLVFSAFNLDSIRDQVQDEVTRFLNLNAIEMTTTTDGGAVEEVNIGTFLDRFIDRAARINYTAIGGVGVLLLVWAALALLITVEDCFNTVCEVGRGRSWTRRIVMYWTVLTLGPLLLSMSLYMSAGAAGLAAAWSEHAGVQFLLAGFNQAGAFAASWLLLFTLYKVMPHTSIHIRSAALGAAISAIAFSGAKWAFGLFIGQAVSFSNIYGVVGLVPLFLLWVYVVWWIVLLGLQVAYTAQSMPAGGFGAHRRAAEARAAADRGRVYATTWALPVMALIAEAFERGEALEFEALRQRLDLPGEFLRGVMDRLTGAALVRVSVEPGGGVQRNDANAEDVAYTLGRPADRIALTEVLHAVEALGTPTRAQGTPGRAVLARFESARDRGATVFTVADLLERGGADGDVVQRDKDQDEDATPDAAVDASGGAHA